MSDAIWDVEYSMAENLKNEIIRYCRFHKINVPKFNENVRSWELSDLFNKIKKEYEKKSKGYNLKSTI